MRGVSRSFFTATLRRSSALSALSSRPALSLGLSSGALLSCRSYASEAAPDYKTLTAVRREVIKEGTGAQAKAGQKAVVHYTGSLLSGKGQSSPPPLPQSSPLTFFSPSQVFDSSRTHGKPFEFRLGAGEVIKGWDIGVAQMKVGETCRLIIPAAQGYGARGAGSVIPPNSVLIFEVELIELK